MTLYALTDSRGTRMGTYAVELYGPFDSRQDSANAAEELLSVTVDQYGNLPAGVQIHALEVVAA